MTAKKRTLLLDSDIIAFKFASTAQKKFVWPNGATTLEVEPIESVYPKVAAYVSSLVTTLKATDVIVCLSCPSKECFRMEVLPTYKENREGMERPVLLQAVKDYLATEWPSYRRDHLEADDIMGILSTHPKLVPGEKIIVSEDKDMKSIPGKLFNPATGKKLAITEEEADHWHMMQTLMGDTTDGYKGCPGVGPKKAEKALLAAMDNPWPQVVYEYEIRGLTEKDALVQARVARILRASDYDFGNKRVILWQPH